MQQDRPRYVVDRPTYNLPEFDKVYEKKSREFPVGEKVKKHFRYRIMILLHSQHELHVFLSRKLYKLYV